MATKAPFEEDDTPRQLPEKFRASTDPQDMEAFKLLQENDERQKELLSSSINAPYLTNTPLERTRSKAYITIQTIEAAANYTPETLERLAECQAIVGRYDIAASLTAQHSDLYKRYWTAVWLDDIDWCNHDEERKYVKEWVFSVKENREMPLLHCSVCDLWNVLDLSYQNKEQLKREADMLEATKGLGMAEKRQYLKDNVRPVLANNGLPDN